MRRTFYTLDVFTKERFTGNPLAVLPDGEGLDTAAMQAIAREFNLSETVFVLPPSAPEHRARLRIFTPARELDFAGHPTVGTAVLLGRLDGGAAPDMILEEGIGPVPCAIEMRGAHGGWARFQLPRLPTSSSNVAPVAAIAAALALEADDIGCEGMTPSSWSAGNPFTFVPVRGLDQIRRCRINETRMADGVGAAFVYCHACVEPGHHFHARMFAPAMGVREDPATGSAVAAFAGLVAERLPDGMHELTIEQGYEMGRPSQISLSITIRDRKLASAAVGGDAVVVMEGSLEA